MYDTEDKERRRAVEQATLPFNGLIKEGHL